MSRADFSDVPAEPPFARAEFATRLATTRAAMADAGLDLLLLHSLPNICYLSGFETPLADWYHCLIVSLEREPELQVCDPELAAMNTYIDTILPVAWEQMDAAAGALGAYLARAHPQARRCGIEMRRPGLDAATDRQLREQLPAVEFVDASDLVPRIRAVKSPAELLCLRAAARLSTLGMRAALDAIHAGVSENEICAAAAQAMLGAGSEYFCIDPIVRAGRRSGVTHATCNRAVVQAGDAVLMELGGVHQRYCAPLLRTAVLGAAPPALARLADTSLQAMSLLFAALRPGRTLGDVASEAMRGLSALDPAIKMRGYFGYSIGIGFPPSWVERSLEIAEQREEVLLPGMRIARCASPE